MGKNQTKLIKVINHSLQWVKNDINPLSENVAPKQKQNSNKKSNYSTTNRKQKIRNLFFP